MKKKSIKVFGWLLTVLVPFIVIMISIRLLISPVFAQIEYRLPGFPEDPFGFTLEDRLKWSKPSITYLVNNEGISYLADLQFDSGEEIFNERELSHMVDVKKVITGMRIALILIIVICIMINVVAVRNKMRFSILIACRRGGWSVIGLILLIITFVAINFSKLFTWFHKLFFESGTWQFFTSDTLIRLFPMRFWQDAFIFVGLLSLIFGVSIILLCNMLIKNLDKKHMI